MRTLLRRLALTGASALLALPPAAASTAFTATAASTAGCSASSAVVKKLPNGTTWQMCWRNSPTAGLVLTDISYRPTYESKPIKVLSSARLAQINVPYDDGSADYNDLTEEQLGDYTLPLNAKDCPGGTLKSFLVTGDAERPHPVKGLCVTTQARGFAYHGDSSDTGEKRAMKDSAQGQDLVLYTVTFAGWYHYITQWNFSDDGTITAKEGATGNLSPYDFDASDSTGWPIGKGKTGKAVSHQHNVFWRLDFAPDGSSGSKLEQYDTKPGGTSRQGIPRLRTTHKTVAKEFAGDAAGDRWWRIVSTSGKNEDGHPRSWEIVQQHTDKYYGHGYTRHDMYFTQYKSCEKFASDNAVNSSGSCQDTVDRFVNGQRLTHPVVWVNVGFHHIARDEDQTPMPVHWQGFQIVPRDVTSMSPLTPGRLHNPAHNGQPAH